MVTCNCFMYFAEPLGTESGVHENIPQGQYICIIEYITV